MKKLQPIVVILLLFTLTASAYAAYQGEWQEGTTYLQGDTVTYLGDTYECLANHTAWPGAGWTPDASPTLWDLTTGGSTPTPAVTSTPTATLTVTPTPTATPVSGLAWDVTFTVKSTWNTGFSADFIIENTGTTPITDWVLEFDWIDAEISSIWNANLDSNTGNHYVIKGNTWNGAILPGTNTSFSINGTPGGTPPSPINYILNGDTAIEPTPTSTPVNPTATPVVTQTPVVSTAPFAEHYGAKPAPQVNNLGQVPSTAPGEGVTINVYPQTKKRDISSAIYGNNLGVWVGDAFFNSTTLEERLQSISPTIMRFPGGSMSDKYHWDGNYPPYAVSQGWDKKSASWNVDQHEFFAMCSKIGSTPLITVNHGYHTYNTTATDGNLDDAVTLAADWVEYCNAPNDGSNPNGGIDWAQQRAADGHPEPYNVKYWEVGNEVYGSWEVGYEPVGSEYGAHFNVFYDAMKAVDPSIHIGICGYVGDADKRSWTESVLSNPGTADRADFIDIHDYFIHLNINNGKDVTNQELLAMTDQIGINKNDLDSVIANHTNRTPGEIKYYFGEYNMSGPESYHSNQLASALFIQKALGEMIDQGFDAASIWNISNGWGADNGDHGILSRKHPTIPDWTPFPIYYPFFFYTRNFGDTLIASDDSDPAIFVYASTFENGEIGLTIINESGFNKTATINLNTFTPSGDVNSWVLTADTLEEYTVYINGVSNGYNGGGPVIEDVIPYYWQTAQEQTITVNIEKYSVTSLVIY